MGDERLNERKKRLQETTKIIAEELEQENPDFEGITKYLIEAAAISKTAESLENTHSRTI